MTENTRIILQRRSQGVPVAADFAVERTAIPSPADAQLLCETLYISLDPSLRGRISGRHLTGTIQPGELVVSEAISRVVESRHPDFAAGDYVAAFSGWQTHCLVDGDIVRRIDPALGPLSAQLGVLGMPGLTAYAGLLRLAEPITGDSLVVSAASGAVGSLVGQLAKARGCRVIGLAGSARKCAWVLDEAGFDACICYKTSNLRQELDRLCPDGINIYYDNVGGDTLAAAMERLAVGARVVLCGLMTQYNSDEVPPGPNPGLIIKARATVRGLVVYDHEDLRRDMQTEVGLSIKEGRIAYLEDRSYGIESAPEAFSRLMNGDNLGKSIVVVADE